MDATPKHLHVALFPYMVQGHMIPTLDIARLFAARDVEATIITTPVNAPIFTNAIKKGNRTKDSFIKIEIFRFPAKEAGLPEGCENSDSIPDLPGAQDRFYQAIDMLQEPLEQYLEETRPDCLVADIFFPWAPESTAKFNIPLLDFHGTGYFPIYATFITRRYKPYQTVLSDDDPFVIPLIPHEIKLSRLQIAPVMMTDEMVRFRKSQAECFGVIVNSFYELEPDYAEFYRKELGIKAWSVGPVSLCNRSVEDKAQRGKQASIDEHECLAWLDSRKPASVIYICFGSASFFVTPQLHEIALALVSSGHNFIWTVRHGNDEWLPPGFEQSIEGRGLIIRGWAPQVLILEHEAVGAFVTHCGWNSTLEGISAGVPMVTWPIFAEQFFNEKLVTEILRTGIPVGVQKWRRMPSVEDIISREAIAKAMREIMEGEKADEMRQKAKQLKEMAWNAVAEGGSSHSDLSALITELRAFKTQKQD